MNNGLAAIRAGFEADKKSYWKMRANLLIKHRGKWVAVHKGRIVAVGDDPVSIMDKAIREDGYAYTNKVGEEDKVLVTKRRRKFDYDKTYNPTALPRISANFVNPILSKNQTWHDIICARIQTTESKFKTTLTPSK